MNEKAKQVVFLDCGGLSDYLDTNPIADPIALMANWTVHFNSSPEQAIERARDADIVVVNKISIDQELLSTCRKVKHIAVSATGYDIVDLAACAKRGVSVSNIPSYAHISVPEHVISMALSLRRELIQYRQQVINQRWQTSPEFCLFDKPIQDLHGSVFGIIGFGKLGQATARLANALGMRVIYHSRSSHKNNLAEQVGFNEVIRESDIVSLHCDLNSKTENMISARELSEMKSDAILINTARGGVANEQDVADAITYGTIGGIGFDVLQSEPPVDGSPLLDIADRSNVIITPHMAWASEAALQTLCSILVGNVHAFINNKPINIVN